MSRDCLLEWSTRTGESQARRRCVAGVAFPLRPFHRGRFRGDARGMDATVMWGFILIGAGALVAGIVGIAIPPGERLGAFLTLVIGAGVGVAALAVGTRNVSSQSDAESAFLIASALGFIAVVMSAALLWLRVPKPPAPPSPS